MEFREMRRKIEKGFDRILIIRMDIEHLTGKEAIELVRQERGGGERP